MVKVVKDFNSSRVKSFSDLMRLYKDIGGFQAKHVGLAFDILRAMIADKHCLKFLTFG